jgi:activator of HSP90 ATPase
MKTRDIHQTIMFQTTALDVYCCLMDERIHSSFTGAKAIISDSEGSSFSSYDGYAVGKNVVLERGKKIVQSWRAVDEEWPVTHESEAAFILSDTAEGCKLEFFHTGVPEALADRIERGWYEYYWEPLAFYLNR